MSGLELVQVAQAEMKNSIPKMVSAYTFKKQVKGSLPLFSGTGLLCWFYLAYGGFCFFFLLFLMFNIFVKTSG